MAAAQAVKQGEAKKVVLERTYRARPEELWELWTTKDGFESWWGPVDFRVEVSELDAKVGGPLKYEMIAATPAMVAEMKRQGQPASHQTRGTFTLVEPFRRLAITHRIDFIPGVAAYDHVTVAEFIPVGDRVKMVITADAHPDAYWTQQMSEGWASQLTKLDRRFGA